MFDELRDNVARLDARVGAIDQKIDRFREELAAAIRALDQKLDRRVDALDQKMSRHLVWTLGVQITVLLAVIGALPLTRPQWSYQLL